MATCNDCKNVNNCEYDGNEMLSYKMTDTNGAEYCFSFKRKEEQEYILTEANGACPKCGWYFENGELDFSHLDSKHFYCPNCGQAVKWDD